MINMKCAIFDLDGTLIDSMGIWDDIDTCFLKKHNLTVPENLKNEISHLTFKETALYFKNKFNLQDSVELIMATWNKMAFYQYSKSISLKPGVIPYLEFLKKQNIKIALATSNTLSLSKATLSNNNILNYFDCIATTDDIGKNKNSPDIYLFIANKLKVPPSNCYVFEDLPIAALSAKKANMSVIGVYDQYSNAHNDSFKTICDYYIRDFFDILKNKKEQ